MAPALSIRILGLVDQAVSREVSVFSAVNRLLVRSLLLSGNHPETWPSEEFLGTAEPPLRRRRATPRPATPAMPTRVSEDGSGMDAKLTTSCEPFVYEIARQSIRICESLNETRLSSNPARVVAG